MLRKTPAKDSRCQRCGNTYTSKMRLQQHFAADHSPKTLKDIRTTKGIKHSTGS